MVRNIWIFCLERLDQRYTEQWYHNIPKTLQEEVTSRNLAFNVITVEGVQNSTTTTAGAFLDFTDTNYYKSTQLCKFIEHMKDGRVGKNDKILFTDFWNPCITQIAYMRDLMDQEWELHSIVHAGAYDPTDILGYKMQKPWPWQAESSWFHSCDYNYYATDFHKDMFIRNLNIAPDEQHRAVRSGQPHGMIVDAMAQYADVQKDPDNLVMWPHRYNADKQPEIAEDLAQVFDLVQVFKMVITQKLNLSKDEYYQMLSRSKIIFSCALHENLGISIMEGVLAGVIPVLPDRCSYAEMYLPEFKYPSSWTENLAAYEQHRVDVVDFISERIHNREKYLHLLDKQRKILIEHYLNAGVMINNIVKE